MTLESEPNNSSVDADELPLTEPVTANLESDGDEDYFRFETVSGGVLALAVDVPTDVSWADYFSFTLLDSSDNVVARYQSGQDEGYLLGIAAAGTYYLRVTPGSDGGNTFHDPGPYTLTATFTAGSVFAVETEDNDSTLTADELLVGTGLTGQIVDSEDVDYFNFETTGASVISVDVDVPMAVENSGSNFYTLALYDVLAGFLVITSWTGMRRSISPCSPLAAITCGWGRGPISITPITNPMPTS